MFILQVSTTGSILAFLYIIFLLPIILLYKTLPVDSLANEDTDKDEEENEVWSSKKKKTVFRTKIVDRIKYVFM